MFLAAAEEIIQNHPETIFQCGVRSKYEGLVEHFNFTGQNLLRQRWRKIGDNFFGTRQFRKLGWHYISLK